MESPKQIVKSFPAKTFGNPSVFTSTVSLLEQPVEEFVPITK